MLDVEGVHSPAPNESEVLTRCISSTSCEAVLDTATMFIKSRRPLPNVTLHLPASSKRQVQAAYVARSACLALGVGTAPKDQKVPAWSRERMDRLLWHVCGVPFVVPFRSSLHVFHEEESQLCLLCPLFWTLDFSERAKHCLSVPNAFTLSDPTQSTTSSPTFSATC